MSEQPPLVKVTEIGEYTRFQSCDRRFKLDLRKKEEARKLPFFNRLFNPLDPVLQEIGRKKEDEWEKLLEDSGLNNIVKCNERAFEPLDEVAEHESHGYKYTHWSDFVKRIHDLKRDQLAYGREVCVEAEIGAFRVRGKIDFILVLWEGDRPKIRLVECKASRRNRTYHHVQVALYQMIVNRLIREIPVIIGGHPIDVKDVECVVARIDETTSEIQDILALAPLDDIQQEKKDIERLLAHDGRLASIDNEIIDNLDYQLNEKCDACVFSVYCLPESARERRLELLGIEPTITRMLRESGIPNIDALAELDLYGVEAEHLKSQISFSENLEVLKQKALARRSTLPKGDSDPNDFEVRQLPSYMGQGQLPQHEFDGLRLVRVYLSVDYDYTENRIVALTAHVTNSHGLIYTGFIEEEGKRHPDPELKEAWQVNTSDIGRLEYEYRPIDRERGKDVIEYKTSLWSGDYKEDTVAERELIQRFFRKLVNTIAEVTESDRARIHFYVWSRSEMSHLVEACSRTDSRLLSHLNELLGCRQGLEQLIYSCLQSEVDYRYALGWTGRGLSVATSLKWFGRRYHWRRRISGEEVNLDRAFAQDIFDFKTTLGIIPLSVPSEESNLTFSWAKKPGDKAAIKHRFEIRSRFYDSLTLPYWHAFWDALPDPAKVDRKTVAAAVKWYNRAYKPLYLDMYLAARAQALRWIEEGIRFKNVELTKPLMTISQLPKFTLGVDSTRQAAIDFLQLDQHINVSDWIATHLVPPVYRITSGLTIPVKDVISLGQNRLHATIDLDNYGVDYETFEANCSFDEGSFVRIAPYSGDLYRGQTLGQLLHVGSTCRIVNVNFGERE